MIRVSTLMLLGFFGTVYGQSGLKGTYCSKQDYVGQCITFLNDSFFEYSSWSCLSSARGSGTYKFYHNSLELFFFSDSVRRTNAFVVNDTGCTFPDTIKLFFSVTDMDSREPMPFAGIKLSGASVIAAALTDIDGNASLIMGKNEKEMKVTVSYAGYEKFSQMVRTDTCQVVQIGLVPNCNRNIETGEKKYVVKHRSRKILKIKEGDYLYYLYRDNKN